MDEASHNQKSSLTREQAAQAEGFAAHYAELSDGELIQLSQDLGQLRESARPILLNELSKRGIAYEYREETPKPAEKRYVGVRGWLLFFVIILIGISPFFSVIELVVTYQQVSGYLGISTRVTALFAGFVILRVAMMVLSIYAGIRLLRIKPNAVRAARMYLNLLVVYGILLGVTIILIKMSTDDKEAGIASALMPIISSLIWRAYLDRSKRVAATYAPAAS